MRDFSVLNPDLNLYKLDRKLIKFLILCHVKHSSIKMSIKYSQQCSSRAPGENNMNGSSGVSIKEIPASKLA